MRKCDNCQVEIKGNWELCPLCELPLDLDQKVVASSYPDVPLKYDKRSITKWLLILSIVIIFATLGLGLIWQGRIQWLQASLFGIMTMWLAVLIILRKRRNVAKSILYLLITLSLLCIYLDYLIGWTGWSTTFAVPIICSASISGLFIAVYFMKMHVSDYVLYLVAAAILGLVPILFLLFNLVTTVIPSWISIGLSALMLVIIFIFRGSDMLREVQKRMFI